MAKKYILVSFPEIQDFMEHPRFNECIFCDSIEGHDVPDSTYAVPEDLYEEIYSKREFRIGETFNFGLKLIQVVENTVAAEQGDCAGCIFHNDFMCINIREYIGYCDSKHRKDGKSIVFVQHKKNWL